MGEGEEEIVERDECSPGRRSPRIEDEERWLMKIR